MPDGPSPGKALRERVIPVDVDAGREPAITRLDDHHRHDLVAHLVHGNDAELHFFRCGIEFDCAELWFVTPRKPVSTIIHGWPLD